VTLELLGEPNWIVFGNPASAHLLTLPGSNLARGSDGKARSVCPNAPGAKTIQSAATTAVTATIATAREAWRFPLSLAESEKVTGGMYTYASRTALNTRQIVN
jgi:hypothetical protein